MPRAARIAPGDHIYHVLNRASGRVTMFDGPRCYCDFLGLVGESAQRVQMRILAYCVMPNHWHMLVWPRHDGDLRRFIQRLTIRHAHRWHVRNGSVGRGSLYQGRYRSFVVEDDAYLLTVCRYIERNPLRARLVDDATDWKWSSAAQRGVAHSAAVGRPLLPLEPLPVELPEDWVRRVNEPQSDAEVYRLRLHVRSGAPFGDPSRAGRGGDPAPSGAARTTRAAGGLVESGSLQLGLLADRLEDSAERGAPRDPASLTKCPR